MILRNMRMRVRNKPASSHSFSVPSGGIKLFQSQNMNIDGQLKRNHSHCDDNGCSLSMFYGNCHHSFKPADYLYKM